MLELKNLSFAASAESGTVDILKHIDLTVEDGKFIVITGPNGGGKTTLAKAIMGLVTQKVNRRVFARYSLCQQTACHTDV